MIPLKIKNQIFRFLEFPKKSEIIGFLDHTKKPNYIIHYVCKYLYILDYFLFTCTYYNINHNTFKYDIYVKLLNLL